MKNVACTKSKQRMLTEHPGGDSGRREAARPGITEMHIKGRISMSPGSCIFPLLSHFSRVRLCGIPETPTRLHQAPPPLGSSRQVHWSGLPFPSAMHESENWKWSRSFVSDLATRWTAAHQAPPSMGFSRQEYWSGLPLPSTVSSHTKH